jgi:hypothetical protein
MWFLMPLGTLLLLLLTTAWQLKKAMPLLTKLPEELNRADTEVLHDVNRDAVCLHADFLSPSCLQVKPTLKLHFWFLNGFFPYLLAKAMPELNADKLSPELNADKLSPECDGGMPIFKRCQTTAKPYSGFSSDYPGKPFRLPGAVPASPHVVAPATANHMAH